jgi:hypothetical protein
MAAMPTNKLWLEHTERAAWESVQALREKLAAAEERLARIGPAGERWTGISEILDAARQRHQLSGQRYGELIADAIVKLDAAAERIRTLEADLVRARQAPTPVTVIAAPVADRGSSAPFDDDDDTDATARAGSRFLRAAQRRYRKLDDSQRAEGVDDVVSAIEGALDEIAEMDPDDMADAAVDLAVLALRLERAARRS